MKINMNSAPSELKITDMKVASIKDAPMPSSIIRLETNQGIFGYGELRDFADPTYALMLKRLLIGENPCNVEKIFRKIKQFGNHGRQGGGVSAVEIALMDLAGKAYNVPIYQLLGGKYRDKVRIYCDRHVHGENTGKIMGQAMQEAIDDGFTLLKMNLRTKIFDKADGLSIITDFDGEQIHGALTCANYTEKALDAVEEYVRDVRAVIGDKFPVAIDHIGYLSPETCVKFAQRLEKYNITWLEDPQPWYMTDIYSDMSKKTSVPLATGEDIYLAENFLPLLEKRAIAVAHPDILTLGGIGETKKLGDLAEKYGVAMAVHMAGTVVGTMAAVHAGAATKNFLAIEFHAEDVEWWGDLISSGNKPKIENGFISVPEGPGLGIGELNDEVLNEHKDPRYPEIWADTEVWNKIYSLDRIWS